MLTARCPARPIAAHLNVYATPCEQDVDRDLELLRSVGVDAVFTPSACEMYPAGDSIMVDPGEIFSTLAEGGERENV